MLLNLLCTIGFVFLTQIKKNPEANLRAIAEGNSRFGKRLYEAVRKEKEGSNLVMSAYSVSSVMAMVAMGAKGGTLKEIRDGMEFPEVKELVVGYTDAFKKLRGNDTVPYNFTLDAANKVFVQEGYQLEQSFVKRMEKAFKAEANETNFAASEVARELINDWVEEQTNDKIKDLIAEDVLSSDTKLVLVNAIYFKGDWVQTFDRVVTFDDDFHVREGNVVQAKMMHNYESYIKIAHISDLNAKAVELPYKGDRVSMYILLPNQKFGLADVEGKLAKTNLNKLFSKVDDAREEETNLVMPKFKMEKSIEMTEHLKALGMTTMFSMSADFSGITGDRSLRVSAVVQKAFIEVNEEGTEAAAATAAVFDTRSVSSPDEEFICDHPFIFFIKDKLTDMVLFTGRVVDPTSSA